MAFAHILAGKHTQDRVATIVQASRAVYSANATPVFGTLIDRNEVIPALIQRIQLLRNIGQFESVSTAATMRLKRLTLVYSENGRGKTTLAAVLRSLSTGDPLPIEERRRLASSHPPHVVIEFADEPPAMFDNGTWNRTLPNIVVFDDLFIDQNIHSGLSVHAHHRQNLHELILGSEAVSLNQRLQSLVSEIESHNRELRAKESALPRGTTGPFSMDEFCLLPQRTDIDVAIAESERAIAAMQDEEAVRETGFLEHLRIPALDIDAISRILQEDLPALDSETLARVQAHLTDLGPNRRRLGI